MINNNIIPNNQMIISVEELKEMGFSLYKINRLVEKGLLRKLNKKFYENMTFKGEELEFYYIYGYVPQGVICLMSAAVYYDLTNYMPDVVDVAIQRKSRVSTLPDWSEIDIHYYTNERYSLGIETIADGKNLFHIYNVEKTVVDIIFYRDKVGIEEAKEVLVNYLRRRDRNLNQLIRYADKCKCGDIMRKYLEVLV